MPIILTDPLTLLALLAAIAIVVYAVLKHGALVRDLGELGQELQLAQSSLAQVRDAKTFLADFQKTDALLRGTKTVGAAWRGFAATLVESERGLLATTRPAEFFGPDLAYRSGVDLRRYDAFPNHLIGLGLLVTFIGLAASLLMAGQGMDGDFNQARSALVTLLAVASGKFVTSIAAIAASLWFSWRKNVLVAHIEAQAERLCAEIERLTVASAAESLIEASYGELRRQNEILEESEEALAGAIAAQLDETLRRNLGSAILPVADAINGMAMNIAGINEAAIHHIVDKLTKEIAISAREHTQAVADKLHQVVRAAETVPNRIEEASARFSAVLQGAAGQMEASLRDSSAGLARLLADAAAGVAESGKAFDAVSSRLEATLRQLEASEEVLFSQAARSSEASAAAAAQVSAAAAQVAGVAEAMEPLAGLNSRVEALAGELLRASQSVSAIVAGSARSISDSQAAAQALAQHAQSFAQGLGDLEGALTGVFEQVGTGIDGFRTKVASAVEGVDASLAGAVERLSEVVALIAAERDAKPARAGRNRSAAGHEAGR